ncbi:MAG: hypothetical protein JKY56_17140 [Kofleriaceae bacterium]|nr:hypothetical protein [Kofleriaceae bacterium]
MSQDHPLAEALSRGAQQSWGKSQLAAFDMVLSKHLPVAAVDGSELQEFCAGLGARFANEGIDVEKLEKLALEDLWIAYRCLQGESRALAALDTLLNTVVPALSTRGFSQTEIEETKQLVRVRLLVAEPGENPRLSLYQGRGRLGGFLRATAIRVALNLRRAESRLAVPQQLELLAKMSSDPALAQLRENYLQGFRSALADAWSTMDDSDRVFVRHQLVDKLTIDEVARIHGIHRSTAARRLIMARERLVEATRLHLQQALDLTETEISSVLRLIHSQLEVALDAIDS